MLGIQELDDLVCSQLTRHDLAQCARLNSWWHSIVIPHLWRDLSWLSSVDSPRRGNTKAFCTMLLEDYLAERQRQKLLSNGNDMGQALPDLSLSPLSAYGHWIRIMPGLDTILDDLQLLFGARQCKPPTSLQLYRHLIGRCPPDVKVDSFRITSNDLDILHASLRTEIIDFTIPRLRRLCIRVDDYHSYQRILRLLDLMDRCSVATLEKLDLQVSISMDTMDQKEDELRIWTSLKDLTLRYTDTTDTKSFLPWLLKRCRNVETLTIYEFTGLTQCLAENMRTCMPNLNGLTLMRLLRDDDLSVLLAGSCKGWKTVKVGKQAWHKSVGMDALAKHFDTLEWLEIYAYDGFLSNHVVQVLRSCGNIHCYHDVQYNRMNYSRVDAKIFMDLDPDDGSLKPWKCERSLKVLKFMLGGVPKPVVEGNAVEEAYTGEGREIQGQVYDRLARLTNLETLWLGRARNPSCRRCLEMSLESGLDKLSGLKKLKELDVTGLQTTIGVKEVQWMTEHWPSLRVIHGLHGAEEEEAAKWLQENHPDILVG